MTPLPIFTFFFSNLLEKTTEELAPAVGVPQATPTLHPFFPCPMGVEMMHVLKMTRRLVHFFVHRRILMKTDQNEQFRRNYFSENLVSISTIAKIELRKVGLVQ